MLYRHHGPDGRAELARVPMSSADALNRRNGYKNRRMSWRQTFGLHRVIHCRVLDNLARERKVPKSDRLDEKAGKGMKTANNSGSVN